MSSEFVLEALFCRLKCAVQNFNHPEIIVTVFFVDLISNGDDDVYAIRMVLIRHNN